MDKRKLNIIILILIIIFLLAGIIYFIFFFKTPPEAMPANETTNTQGALPSAEKTLVKEAEINKNQNAEPATEADITRFNLSKIASSFAERLGSYSNQSNFSNILDLKVFMTLSMQKWADDYVVKAQKNNNYSGIYQGVTTRAISSEVKSYSENPAKADVLVHTQKVQSSGTTENSSTYQEDLLITFIKESGQWKVDNARWQGKKQ